MQKNYLSKLGILTSIFCNCSLPETNQQLSDEKFTSLKKDLKKLLSQNVLNNGHHQRQIYGMQNSIKDLKNDVSNLTQLLNSQTSVNIQLLQNIEKNKKTIQEQVEKLKELTETVTKIKQLQQALDDTLKKQKEELNGKASQEDLNKLIPKIKEIDKLKQEIDDLRKQKEALENKLNEQIKNGLKDKGNEIDKLKQEIDDLRKQKEALENKLNEQIKNELKGKVDKTALEDALKEQKEELENALKELSNTIQQIKDESKELKTQLNELQDSLAEKVYNTTIARLQKKQEETENYLGDQLANNLNVMSEIIKDMYEKIQSIDSKDTKGQLDEKLQAMDKKIQSIDKTVKDKGCCIC